MKKSNLLLVIGVLVLIAGGLSSCKEEEIQEPAIYAPKQLKRLLLNESTKTWSQISAHFLVDSCRTGYRLRFQDHPSGKIDSGFTAEFLPDPSLCGITKMIRHKVKIKISPIYQTTDSLLFITPQKDTIIKTVHLITSQRLQLKVAGKNGEIVAVEEYQAIR